MGIYFTGNFKTSAAFWQQQTRSRRTFTTQECTMNRPKVHTRYSCTSKEKEKTRSSYYKSMDIKWMHLLRGCVIFQYITITAIVVICLFKFFFEKSFRPKEGVPMSLLSPPSLTIFNMIGNGVWIKNFWKRNGDLTLLYLLWYFAIWEHHLI